MGRHDDISEQEQTFMHAALFEAFDDGFEIFIFLKNRTPVDNRAC